MANTKTTENSCRPYLAGRKCKDGRDHCFNCGRHLDGEECSKGCGTDEAVNDAANSEDAPAPASGDEMNAGQDMDLDLLRADGAGWQTFDATEKRILRRVLIALLRQDMTTTGTTNRWWALTQGTVKSGL